MDVWIETVAGNLFCGFHTDRITLRETEGSGAWEVAVGASVASGVFAVLRDEAQAKSIRNSLVLGLAEAKKMTEPQVLAFDTTDQRVKLTAMAR